MNNKNALGRISKIISLLLSAGKNDGRGLPVDEISRITGIPAIRIADDLYALLSNPFFKDCISVTDAGGNSVSRDKKMFFERSSDIYIKSDPDFFHYGYEEDKTAVMFTETQRFILSGDTLCKCKDREEIRSGKGGSITPMKVKIKITNPSEEIIKNLSAGTAKNPGGSLTPSETEKDVWYAEDIVYDKNTLFAMLLKYGENTILLEPEHLAKEFTGLLEDMIQRIDEFCD